MTNLTWYDHFKPASIEVVSILRYPYLLSAYCYPSDHEIVTNMATIVDTFSEEGGGTLMIQNCARYFGSILLQLIELDACYLQWDGGCLGAAPGQGSQLCARPEHSGLRLIIFQS